GALAVGVALPATALPPGGASSDTPGTSASVSPTTLSACDTISFTVSGFPAGETVYVKIDDGVGYGDTSVQGTGVVYKQAIPASGTVNGSFALPCGITEGSHWLRFLASAYVDASDPSKGTVGYTHAGGTDFTVVAASSGSSGSSGASDSGGSSSSGTTGSGSSQNVSEGSVLTVTPGPTVSATVSPTPSASGTVTAEPTAATTVVGDGIPWIGIVVGAGLVVVAGVVVTVLLVRRRPTAP
ncbi:MAG: hypothetical protein QM626_01550, partial [Microbacterium sp.]